MRCIVGGGVRKDDVEDAHTAKVNLLVSGAQKDQRKHSALA